MAEQASGTTNGEDEEEYPATPWHFKFLFIALVLYLSYRAIQLFVWLFHYFF